MLRERETDLQRLLVLFQHDLKTHTKEECVHGGQNEKKQEELLRDSNLRVMLQNDSENMK